jgi:hypothetical protein
MSSTTADGLKSVKVPTFDGKRDSFQVWWMRFAAFAKAYKFYDAVQEQAEGDLPDKEKPSVHDTKDEIAARERNSTAMYYLVLAFTTPEAMKFLYKGITAEYPSGLAWKVRTSMFKRFKPMDDTSKLELSQALMTIKMKSKESPAALFTQICYNWWSSSCHDEPCQCP